MNLVLVESPTKARKLSQFLGKEFMIEASMGHVRDLPSSKMGVDVEHAFEPTYEITQGRKTIISKLKKQAKNVQKIILATDPDREGEAIAWHLQYLLEDKKKKGSDRGKFVRSTFHEITKSAVLDAIEHPSTLNLNLVDAQQARRIVDRLVGYYLSPVLWKKIRRGLSAGRVQSVALRLITEREKEIQAFVPNEYWEVDVLLEKDGTDFYARVVQVDKKKYEPHTTKDVSPILIELTQAEYVVKDVEKKQRKRSCFPPYTTSTLQQAGANKLGWSAKQTMRVAQELYEEGYITYHRTDSTALSAQAISSIRDHISAVYGKEYLPDSPNYFKKTSKNVQEAHEAIRPTRISVEDPKEIKEKKGERHEKLYQLIWKRFAASQMKPALYDQTSIIITGEGKTQQFLLKVSGSRLVFDGWMKLFPQKNEVEVPAVHVQDTLIYKDTRSEQKFTQPPPRYNDASLVKTLEKLGIGRPSTYALIISVLLDRMYVEQKEKAFYPTVIGVTVADFLLKHFPKEMDYQFTAEMEDNLDSIARGEKKWKQVLKTFFFPFEKKVEKVTQKGERAKVPVEETGKSCPDCQDGTIVIRSGRFGKFYSCSKFPDCKYTASYTEKVEGVVCPECEKGDIVAKRTRRGRMFYGCSSYPKCSYATWNKPQVPEQNKETL